MENIKFTIYFATFVVSLALHVTAPHQKYYSRLYSPAHL
jgi:hypothetical protein